ncbi:MAG TPA: hypothetical protein VFA41_16385 [Ktedonobacteraceae bacterium]|nr:hypothetical protein [Ktedonobacteraceae bacterium]
MNTIRGFFWPEDASLKKQRLLLGLAFLLASALWFVLGALLAVAPDDQFLWSLLWIAGTVIALAFTRLLKTRQCQSA